MAIRLQKPPPSSSRAVFIWIAITRRSAGWRARPWGLSPIPGRSALRIEKYVWRKIAKKNYTITFATASQVAENLEGDCRQHAVLAAAMCRAAGVPSRTAVGLVYVLDASASP